MGSLLAGTHLRGSFSARLDAIKKEVKRSENKIIVFIDEIHTLIGAGSGDSALDAANDLKASLARGEFPCIGATTTKEYKRYIESDPALERRFQPIVINEPSIEETKEILNGIVGYYQSHHGIAYTPEAIDTAVRLAGRYITDRCFPDKAINLLDLAGSRARRNGSTEVQPEDIAAVLSPIVSIPLEKLILKDTERLLEMESSLSQLVVGHKENIERVAHVIRRNYAGFHGQRPIGSFLFLGPTGVGKSLTAKALAEFLFHNSNALTRFDMSEFSESHSLSKLIGAPPGYIGHDQGGQLTEVLHKKPFQILLFDEIEKAAHDILPIFLQMLEEGQVTDSKGKKVYFNNTIVILTSNLGSDLFSESRKKIGFGAPSGEASNLDTIQRVFQKAREVISDELWNRIEEKLVFMPLTHEEVKQIAQLLLRESSERLEKEKNISYHADPEVIDFLIENGGYNPNFGARPMRQVIQRHIESLIAKAILSGTTGGGNRLRLSCVDGRIRVHKT
jgi:ATP-dependent Clp protease ATP-binding subunit ClpC